ncbi:hypothetical protein [Sorangium sp. So ce233]|uniref:hypothetical protein n=1 Tax=Sorangium sp. So ce233 TaxID=3133290 RepID=UPI003F5FF866
MPVTPQQGHFVRSRLYLVDQVAQDAPDEDAVVHLSCLDDGAQAARLSVLWQREVDAQIVDAASWREVAARGLDAPRTFAAYLNAQRWHYVTSTRPRLFQAPHRAGLELHAYQLEPLRKRDEVLARLIELNRVRAEDERRRGVAVARDARKLDEEEDDDGDD